MLKPVLCVVDSIAAMSDPSLPSLAGSVPQVRHGAERLCAAAKFVGASLVLVGHVTKDGELAGPRTLEHLVDTVLRIEGDRDGSLRILRALKHRFGATSEVGLLEMAGAGLRDLPEASLALPDDLEVSGVAMGVATDGSRSLLVEIQALVATGSGAARRVAHQLSSQRLSLLLAVLEVRCGIDTSTSDVLAASAGGLPALEPGVDVALALAIASAARGFAIAREVVCVGEVGLAGELRSVAGSRVGSVRPSASVRAPSLFPSRANSTRSRGFESVAAARWARRSRSPNDTKSSKCGRIVNPPIAPSGGVSS